MKNLIIYALILTVTVSCANWNNQQKGTAIGSAGGAAIGAAVSKGSIWGVLAGAAIGGAAGNLIGKKMDQQAKELAQAIPTAEVQRIDEGINVTFDASLAFEINSATLSDSYKEDLTNAIPVFQKYPDTNILIEGHTDDSGSDEFNMQLSEKRAKAVSSFLADNGVERSRLIEKWYGETQPKYPNDDENRAKNRRVEMAIYANSEMQEQAQSGDL
ncbi:OmpA family protein [Echinicola sp. CAU 1574]|uniref:OmpA family protein n=1 Tax=Echinicola arenosa TaxID=2774144 RepID=A0ABR9AJY7_9BACT|nr:OmpA family protein [Echinicola arenosa]MBD8489025.1 OmpA family protein [Echinicola arenosa]